MYRFATVIFAGIVATVPVIGIAFMPTPADAAKTSSADKAALKETTLACKAEAKDKKIRWPASRKIREHLRCKVYQTYTGPKFRKLL